MTESGTVTQTEGVVWVMRPKIKAMHELPHSLDQYFCEGSKSVCFLASWLLMFKPDGPYASSSPFSWWKMAWSTSLNILLPSVILNGGLVFSADLAFLFQVCSGGTTPDWWRRSWSSRMSSWAQKAANIWQSSWTMAQIHRSKVSTNTQNYLNRFHLKSLSGLFSCIIPLTASQWPKPAIPGQDWWACPWKTVLWKSAVLPLFLASQSHSSQSCVFISTV